MSDLINDWQQALIARLKLPAPDGIDFDTVLDFRRDGISTEQDIAVVFPDEPSMRTIENRSYCNFFMTIRAWKRWKGEPSQNIQPNADAVNTLAIDICTALQPVQTGLLDENFYFWVESTTIDRPAFGVEVKLTGWAINPARLLPA